MSLTVTDLAATKLKEYLSQNNIDSALRVALMQGGWSGPSLGLALDEPKENDKVYDQSELTFLVEDSLLETCGAINVEYIEAGPRSGFGISSTNPIGGGGCSSGSCGSNGCGWFWHVLLDAF
jgi:iron-sulfur cluster assembly protein